MLEYVRKYTLYNLTGRTEHVLIFWTPRKEMHLLHESCKCKAKMCHNFAMFMIKENVQSATKIATSSPIFKRQP